MPMTAAAIITPAMTGIPTCFWDELTTATSFLPRTSSVALGQPGVYPKRPPLPVVHGLASFCLSGCFSNTQYLGPGRRRSSAKVHGPAYLFISCRFATGSKAEQGLERGHGLPAAIVAKNKFIEINL